MKVEGLKGPFRCRLRDDVVQIRTHLASILETACVMATPATRLLVEVSATIEVGCLRDVNRVGVAFEAPGLRKVRRVHRAVPIVIGLPVVLLLPLHRLDLVARSMSNPAKRGGAPAAVVAAGTTEIIHRVRRFPVDIEIQLRMGTERLRGVRIVRVIDPEMARHATVDPGYLHEVQVLGHVLHQNLFDLDGGVDEIYDGEIPEEVGEAYPDGIQLAGDQIDALGQ
jgi:hypothetical protein